MALAAEWERHLPTAQVSTPSALLKQKEATFVRRNFGRNLVQNLTPLAIIFPTLKTSPSWKDRNASSDHYDVSLRGARKQAR
jgi:hypothetical protein